MVFKLKENKIVGDYLSRDHLDSANNCFCRSKSLPTGDKFHRDDYILKDLLDSFHNVYRLAKHPVGEMLRNDASSSLLYNKALV